MMGYFDRNSSDFNLVTKKVNEEMERQSERERQTDRTIADSA